MLTFLKRTLHFALLIFGGTFNTLGQPKCKVEFYTTEQGLSHQAVTSILKDREGFMWFGSWDGINRFDGHSFTAYKSYAGDMSQLGNDRIDQIVEDQSGHLWIEAYDRQVYRFDKKTEQFQPLSKIFSAYVKVKIHFNRILSANNGLVWLLSENDGVFAISQSESSKQTFINYNKEANADYKLPSNGINFWYEDREKQIWAGTFWGLANLTPFADGNYKNSRIVPPALGEYGNYISVSEDAGHLFFGTASGTITVFDKQLKTFFSEKISDGRVNALLKSRKTNSLYVTTSSGELISFDIAKQKVVDIRKHSPDPLYSMYEDAEGSLWIEPQKLGAIHYNPTSRSFQLFVEKNAKHFNVIGNRFRILEDNNGLVWVNMKGGGFGYFNPQKDSIENNLNTPDGSMFTLPKIVYSIFLDPAGILWLTTDERQLLKIILQGNDFKQTLLAENGFSRADNEVRGILCDNQDRLWLGAKSGRLYVYKDNKKIQNIFDNEPPGGLGMVYSMLQDSKGNIWLGTKGNGLYKATPVNKAQTSFHLSHFVSEKNKPNSLICNEIYAMLEDHQGRIWIGSFDHGLVLIDESADSINFVHTGIAFLNYPKGNFQKIRHMALDEEGNIWIGTTGGVVIFDANETQSSNYKYTTYSKIPGDKESLGNNDVQYIYRDSKNRMWIASSGGGLCLAIGKKVFETLKFRNYTTRDGLPNDYVLSCSEDADGHLWIATENGLSEFRPDANIFKNYDSYEGLPRAGFSEAAVSRLSNNKQFFFGTSKGYLSFNPQNITTNRIAANIVFTNLQINNRDVGPKSGEGIIDNNINYVSNLRLKYNQNIILIDYAILDYRSGNRPAFAYRLAGFDNDWHSDDRSQRRVTYTNLSPGHYVFELKSLDSDLYSNAPYRKLSITILPPPWKTWWAYTLYCIAAIVLFFFIRRTALAMIRLRNKIAIEQKLAALKLKFFTNVSHELRTPLTLIINPIEQVIDKENLSPEGNAYLEVAQKNANRMVRFINQLLDLRKIESNKASLKLSRIEVVSFTNRISEHFTAAMKEKRIQFEIHSEQKEIYAWADADKFDVIVYNLLGNAVKFTREGRMIKILITRSADESFSIAVHDQGSGVEEGKIKNIFELFYEGDHPASRESKGSGIGLALTREFVHLHRGEIWAANNEDGGLTVTFRLKTNPNHYGLDYAGRDQADEKHTNEKKRPDHQVASEASYLSSKKDGQSPVILLAEDNDELRSFLNSQLSEYYNVEIATNGEEGLNKAITIIPDLIISDIMMPVMDGIQMLDAIKNNLSTSHIPVVLLSARHSIESQIEGLKYGADFYITKPFNNQFLIASVDNLLKQRKKLFESIVKKKQSLDPTTIPVITSKDEIFLREVVKAVEEKMDDPTFNIESMAESMLMSRTTFYKKFKSLTGFAPVEFVRDMRLQRAKQYLDEGGNNVSEAAYLAGFASPKYFSTCFREKYHVSPSDYLKSKVG